MPVYKVYYSHTVEYLEEDYYIVEADSKKAAEEKSLDRAGDEGLIWVEVDSIEELKEAQEFGGFE